MLIISLVFQLNRKEKPQALPKVVLVSPILLLSMLF